MKSCHSRLFKSILERSFRSFSTASLAKSSAVRFSARATSSSFGSRSSGRVMLPVAIALFSQIFTGISDRRYPRGHGPPVACGDSAYGLHRYGPHFVSKRRTEVHPSTLKTCVQRALRERHQRLDATTVDETS